MQQQFCGHCVKFLCDWHLICIKLSCVQNTACQKRPTRHQLGLLCLLGGWGSSVGMTVAQPEFAKLPTALLQLSVNISLSISLSLHATPPQAKTTDSTPRLEALTPNHLADMLNQQLSLTPPPTPPARSTTSHLDVYRALLAARTANGSDL